MHRADRPSTSRGRALRICQDDLTGERIAHFLQEHLDEMRAITPPESVHALDLQALRAPDITFWSVWGGDQLLGCGALRELDSTTGEIKAMRTAAFLRGEGIGSKLLEHIVEEARRRGYDRLLLETGALPAFVAARAFYRAHGFDYRGSFGEYSDDPNSVFMTRKL